MVRVRQGSRAQQALFATGIYLNAFVTDVFLTLSQEAYALATIQGRLLDWIGVQPLSSSMYYRHPRSSSPSMLESVSRGWERIVDFGIQSTSGGWYACLEENRCNGIYRLLKANANFGQTTNALVGLVLNTAYTLPGSLFGVTLKPLTMIFARAYVVVKDGKFLEYIVEVVEEGVRWTYKTVMFLAGTSFTLLYTAMSKYVPWVAPPQAITYQGPIVVGNPV